MRASCMELYRGGGVRSVGGSGRRAGGCMHAWLWLRCGVWGGAPLAGKPVCALRQQQWACQRAPVALLGMAPSACPLIASGNPQNYYEHEL